MPAHHAYVAEGSVSDFEPLKLALHPFVAAWHERFGIDEARALVAQASLRREGQTTYLIGTGSITTEAQQALLKLFEEPRAGLTFVLLVPHGILLPTLRSRMMEYPMRRHTAGAFAQESAAFLTATGKARSDIVAELLEDEEGARERVRQFLLALEVELHKNIKNERARRGLEDIAMVRDYLRDRSPSLKILLEHLALGLPAA